MNDCGQRRPFPLAVSKIKRPHYILDFFHFAISILSGVIGNSLILFPDALYTALATAAANPIDEISPSPLEPTGFMIGSGLSINIASISGTSAFTGTW